MTYSNGYEKKVKAECIACDSKNIVLTYKEVQVMKVNMETYAEEWTTDYQKVHMCKDCGYSQATK